MLALNFLRVSTAASRQGRCSQTSCSFSLCMLLIGDPIVCVPGRLHLAVEVTLLPIGLARGCIMQWHEIMLSAAEVLLCETLLTAYSLQPTG